MQSLRRRAATTMVTALLCLSLFSSAQKRQTAGDDDALAQCRALVQGGRAADAVPLLQAYVAKRPESVPATYLLAYAYFATKEPRLSLELYTRGASLRAPSAGDLMAVSADYILLKDYADAAKWLTRVTSMQPTNVVAWYYLGRALHLSGRYPEALDAFTHALTQRPHYIRAEIGIGLTKEAQGDDAGAMEAYSTAMQWQEGTAQQDAQPYLSAGELLLKLGKNDQALQHLKTAASFSHENPRVLEDLGKVYERIGRYKDATTALEQAEQLAPGSSTVHFLLGTAYQRQGRKPEADKEFGLASGLLSTSSNQATENFDLQP